MRDAITRFVFSIPLYEITAVMAVFVLAVFVIATIAAIASSMTRKGAEALVSAEMDQSGDEPSRQMKRMHEPYGINPATAEYQVLHMSDSLKL